jgi:hypothetical protein
VPEAALAEMLVARDADTEAVERCLTEPVQLAVS